MSLSDSFDNKTTAEEVAKIFSEEIRGKNVLITGASPRSLGSEATRVISKYANLVIIAGRNETKLAQTIADIRSENPAANIRTLIVDLGSLASVRKAAAEVNGYSESINVLVNNAAIMATPYSTTEDGYESQFATNHLAHFLFTTLIFPKIVAASSPEWPSRVVNVSSRGHFRSAFLDDYGFSEGKTYEPWTSYGQSKTANILFANELAKRAKAEEVNVLAYSLHPGVILTNLSLHLPNEELIKLGLMNEKGEIIADPKTIHSGTATHIAAAFDPSIKEQSGAYLADAKIAEAVRAPHAASPERAEKLWELSETLVAQKFVI